MRTTSPALAIFMTFLIVACDSGSPLPEKKTETLVRPAKLIEVGQANENSFLNFPAVIQSRQRSVLSFEVGGMLKELMVIEAQKVEKGDVLAKLDQRDLLALLTSARAQFNNANIEYQRALRLIKQDAISRSELEQRKSKQDVNKAQLDTAEKALQDSVLIAPFSGAIAKISIKKWQITQPGESAITILGKQGLEAKINLPSSILAKGSRQEKPATDSYLVLDAAPDRQIPVLFREASLEADEATQTYAVTFSFDKPEGLIILPGMNAVVWFKDPSKSDANLNKLSVPLTAIAIDGVNLNVISGLQSGDMIVAAGVSSLSEGMKVRLWSKD